jgi:purine-nucleoside phosphorylase
LDNKITKAVDFVRNESSERTLVFDGTYTAKKGDIYLNTVIISGAAPTDSKNKVSFNITVGDEEISADLNSEETFDDVLVKAGESVNVKVEVTIDAYGTGENLTGYVLTLK